MLAEMLWSVTAVSVVGGIMLHLLSEKSKIAPYIQFLLSLILLVMLLSPLAQLLAAFDLTDLSAYAAPTVTAQADNDYWGDAVTAQAVARAEASLAALISAETGIAVSDMTAALTTERVRGEDGDEITVTGVEVTLHRRAHRIAAEKIRALVERVMYCPCTVRAEEGWDA